MNKALPLVVLMAAVGCSPPPSHSAPPSAASLASPAHDGDALTADEAAVKAFILDNADDSKSVEFARWGPDVPGDAFRAVLREADAAHEAAYQKEYAKWEEAKRDYDAERRHEEDKPPDVPPQPKPAPDDKPQPPYVPKSPSDPGPVPTFPPEPPAPFKGGVNRPAANAPEPPGPPPSHERGAAGDLLAATGDLRAVVRVRFRSDNRQGAKELSDLLFFVANDGKASPWPGGRAADDWFERFKAEAERP